MSNELWLLLVGGVGVAAVVLIVTTWPRRRDLGAVSDRWIAQHRAGQSERQL
jgi:hypothetical protein